MRKKKRSTPGPFSGLRLQTWRQRKKVWFILGRRKVLEEPQLQAGMRQEGWLKATFRHSPNT